MFEVRKELLNPSSRSVVNPEGQRHHCFSNPAVLIVAAFVGYLIAVFLIILLFHSFESSPFNLGMRRWPETGPPNLASYFGTWDAAHYLHLAEHGYQAGDRSCAFYPLWPMLISSVTETTGIDPVLVGMFLANCFSAAGMILFWHLIRNRFDVRTAWWGCAFLFFFPGSLFYHFIYSEPLFFLLLMLVVGDLQHRARWAWAPAFLLPLTRAIGAFAVLPIAAHFVLRCLRQIGTQVGAESADTRLPTFGQGRFSASYLWCRARVSRNLPSVARIGLVVAAPVLGYGTYFALMTYWTNNPFEGFAAQETWEAHSIANLVDLPAFVSAYFHPHRWHAFRGSFLDRLFFLLFVLTLPVIWRLDKGWFVWALVLGLVPAMSGHFVSYTRFASVVFPMFIALAVVLSRPHLWWARWGLLMGFVVLHLILVWRFVNFRWAG